jgi:hypothetical protein
LQIKRRKENLALKKYVIASILLCLLMMTPPIYIASAASTTLAVNPLNSYVTIGHAVNVDINVTDVANLTSWQFTLYFLNAVLNCTGMTEGPFLQTGGGTFFGKIITNNFNSTHGKLVAYSTLLGTTKVDGSGVLATITFDTLSVGDSPLHLSDTKLGDEKIPPQPIPHTIIDGSVHVQNFTLTVSTVGSGSVSLNYTVPYYHYGEAVKLTATPDTDWSFQYWSGDLSGSASPVTLVMTGNFSVTAYFLQTPTLQMSPASKTCRVYSENFTVTIAVTNAASVTDFKLEIHYNTTLLNYVAVTWNVWGTGTITVDEANGNITVSNSGTSISGTQTLTTINFTASFNHIWKVAPGWTNDLTDIIFFQWANVSYPSGPDLRYERGGSSQINVGPDFAYTFSPIQGDVDNNGIVELFDLRAVAFYFGFNQGDSGWDDASKYDLNGDGTIDVYDLRIIAVNFGYTYP